VTVGALAIPQFWLGLMLLSLFYSDLHVLPGPIGRLDSGVDPPPHLTGMYLIDATLTGHWALLWMTVRHLVLPVFVLACGVFAPVARITRAAMVEALGSDFVVAARAAGFPERTVRWRYALKSALLPVITMGANGIAFALTGTVLVENVFGWPGVGQYALTAVQQSDFPALQGFVLYASIVYVLLYLLADLAYVIADPRLRT
jgi:peptide/nickel transport system permease protein